MRPRVKICGIRRLEDALLAAELGADAVGFVFWPESPRFIDPYRARDIARRLPPFMSTRPPNVPGMPIVCSMPPRPARMACSATAGAHAPASASRRLFLTRMAESLAPI